MQGIDLAGVDIVFLIIIVFTSIRAGIRGFVKELMSMASVILGIAVAVLFSGVVAEYLDSYIGASPWSQVISFLGLFLLTYLGVKIFESALDRLIERIHLDSLDHALGFFLGIAEGLVVTFMLLLLIQIQPFVDPALLIEDSVLAHFLSPLFPYISEILSRQIGNV
ncbi:MAG: CvpA family protein [Alkalispirochaetaceae bacterium]